MKPQVEPTQQPLAARGAAAPQQTPLQQLAALVDRLGRRPAPSLKSVARHQATWSRLRAEQRLRQAGARVPAKAGPLHSAQVVYRALLEMQQICPAYLDALLAQVDSLVALEQASGALLPLSAGARPGSAAPAGPPPAAPRSKARARR